MKQSSNKDDSQNKSTQGNNSNASKSSSSFQNSNNDESGPPPLINLMAENYRLRYAARQAQAKSPSPTPAEPPRPVVSILIEDTPGRIPQNERHVHFFPEKDDVIPRHAQVFDIDRAIFEYNSKVEERRQLALLYAEMLCDTPSSTNLQQRPRFSVAQRLPVTSPFEDVGYMYGYTSREQQKQQQQRLRVRSYVPSKIKKPNSRPRPRTTESSDRVEHLGDSLMISKVSVPSSPRRTKSQKTPTLTPGAITAADLQLNNTIQSNSTATEERPPSEESNPGSGKSRTPPRRTRSLNGSGASMAKSKMNGQRRYASPPPRAYRTMPAVPISRDASEPINDTYHQLSPQQKMQQFIAKQKMKMEDDEEFDTISNDPEFRHF